MKFFQQLAVVAISLVLFAFCPIRIFAGDRDCVVYEGGHGAGEGKHLVFLSGDEEYRSEEGLVQLAKILAFRHGFQATVLFAIEPGSGEIDPNTNNSLPGAPSLRSADAMVMGLRFRHYPDDVMQPFVEAYLAGKPIVAVRTSTHAFYYPANSESRFAHYAHDSKKWPGGFGRQVLGETWVSHLGANHQQATLGIPVAEVKDHPLLRGVGQIFAHSGAYTADPMPDSTILVRGRVLSGMTPDAAPVAGKKYDPAQPVAWARVHRSTSGNANRVLCTTMGAATDLLDANLRRLLVNGIYWGLKMDVPQQADVRLIGEYKPSEFNFNGFRKGVKPADLAMTAAEALRDD